MKIRALVFAVFVMALGAVAVHAAPSQMFGIGGGLSLPTGDASDFVSTGFHFGGTYCYKLDPQFGLGADVFYHMLGEKDQGVILGSDWKTSANALQAGVHGKYFFPMKDAKMAPYIKVGAGMYNMSVKLKTTENDVTVEATKTSSEFGFNGGLGCTFDVNAKSSIGVELLYHQIQKDSDLNDKAINVFTAGVTYNFMLGK